MIKQGELKEWYSKNEDPYGHAAVKVGEIACKLLEADNPNEITKEYAGELIHRADRESGEGITGAMAGYAASVVVTSHSRGEEFRKAWNESLSGNDHDGGGVANPAFLTVSTQDD